MKAGETYRFKDPAKLDGKDIYPEIKLTQYLKNDNWKCLICNCEMDNFYLTFSGNYIYKECIKIGEA